MKKQCLILSLLAVCAVSAFGGICVYRATGNGLIAIAEDEDYSISVNKSTVKKMGFLYYVTTTNGNNIYVGAPDADAGDDGIYTCSDNGDGNALFSNSIQAITEISITYKFPTSTVQAHGGYFSFYVGDYTPSYYNPEEGQHQEELSLTNNNDTKQTQTFTLSEPSKCNYISWWYALPSYFLGEGNVIIYDITVKYNCV